MAVPGATEKYLEVTAGRAACSDKLRISKSLLSHPARQDTEAEVFRRWMISHSVLQSPVPTDLIPSFPKA